MLNALWLTGTFNDPGLKATIEDSFTLPDGRKVEMIWVDYTYEGNQRCYSLLRINGEFYTVHCDYEDAYPQFSERTDICGWTWISSEKHGGRYNIIEFDKNFKTKERQS